MIYLVQNVFEKGRSSRTVSLNAHYHIVFRNRRDASQFRIFASEMSPHRSGWLLDAFEDATRKPFGYLLIDNHPRTADEHRIRTCILPGEQVCYYTERRQDLDDQPPPYRRLNHMNRRKNKRHRSPSAPDPRNDYING